MGVPYISIQYIPVVGAGFHARPLMCFKMRGGMETAPYKNYNMNISQKLNK
jgi:hypothetical protein